MDELGLMKKALELAEKGNGSVSPNPMVGAVIVKDGQIIGEGYHRKYGEAHAEINAINQAGAENCKNAVLFVTLEPCAHEGKTPPCVEAVIKAGFHRVIIGMTDPNPLTDGRSISKMMEAGIKVDVGVMEAEVHRQNEAFIKYITSGMPFVTIKIAQTVDARIADINNQSHWITGEKSRQFVHKLRHQADAILIGGRTALLDNPSLTVRHVEGTDPYRIILSTRETLPENLKIFAKNDDQRTIVASTSELIAEYNKIDNLKIWQIDKYESGRLNLGQVLIKAAKEKIANILVEGGSRLFSEMLKRKFVDKVYISIAPRILGEGVPAFEKLGIDSIEHSIELTNIDYSQKGDDVWMMGYPVWK